MHGRWSNYQVTRLRLSPRELPKQLAIHVSSLSQLTRPFIHSLDIISIHIFYDDDLPSPSPQFCSIFSHTSFNIHNSKSAAIYVNQIMWRVEWSGRTTDDESLKRKLFFSSSFATSVVVHSDQNSIQLLTTVQCGCCCCCFVITEDKRD